MNEILYSMTIVTSFNLVSIQLFYLMNFELAEVIQSSLAFLAASMILVFVFLALKLRDIRMSMLRFRLNVKVSMEEYGRVT